MSGQAAGPARLVLLRHARAQTDGCCAGQRMDPTLTVEGAADADAAVSRLGALFEVAQVVASPALRARATAAPWGGPVVIDDDLAERDFGAWEGQPWTSLWAGVPAAVREDPAAYAAFTPPGGETLEEVDRRAWRAALRWTDEPGRTVLLVTHAGPLRLILGRAIGLAPPATFALGAPHAHAAVLSRFGTAWTLDRLGA